MESTIIKQAIEIYGYETVNSVIEMANSHGENHAYDLLIKSGEKKHAECISKLYTIKND